MKSLVAEVYCALKAQNNYGPQTTIGSHTDLPLLSVGISDTDWDPNMPLRVFIQIRNLNDWWSYRKKHLNQIQLPSKMVNENHGLCQFYLKFPFWFHENIGLMLLAFLTLLWKPHSDCGNDEESLWEKQNFTLGQVSDFACSRVLLI